MMPEQVALAHLEAHVAHGGEAAEALGHVLQAQHDGRIRCGSCRRPRPAGPAAGSLRPGQPLGDEAHDQDQDGPVDDQVDAGEARLHAEKRGAQIRLQRRDEDRAEEGAERGARCRR